MSVRTSVMIAVAVTAVLALVASYFLGKRISNQQELIKSIKEDRAVAAVLAEEAAKTDNFSELKGSTILLLQEEKQRATIVINGVVKTYGATLNRNSTQVRARQAFDSGYVILSSNLDSAPDLPVEFVAFGSGILVVVLGAAVLVNAAATREVSRRASQAVVAADRVASGDFSARMGPAGAGILAPLSAAFDSMAERLEQSERDQRRFLADLAHEIATPLNTVAGFALAVVDGTIPKDRAEGLIKGETARISELLDDLTQLRTLDTNDDDNGTKNLDLADVCKDLVSAFEPVANEAGVHLRAKTRHTVVRANTRLVETVARNLVSNAIRYTPDGGHVEVGCASSGAKGPHMFVKDSGIGIGPEHQARVFDRFYRVDEARDRQSGGSGLGLAIAKRAAEAMGGHIELHSAPKSGSEFFLYLPAPGTGSH